MKAKFIALAIMAVLAVATAALALSPVYTFTFAPKVKLVHLTNFFGKTSGDFVDVKSSSMNKVTYKVTKSGTTIYYGRTTGFLDVTAKMTDTSTEQLYLSWNKLANDADVTVTTNSASKFVMTIDNVNILHRTRTYTGGSSSTATYDITDETLTGPVTITYYKSLKKMDIVGPGFSLIGVKAY